jgi:hypothetical protein
MANGYSTFANPTSSAKGGPEYGPGGGGIFGQDVSVGGIHQAKVDPNAFQWGGDPNAAQNTYNQLNQQGYQWGQTDSAMANKFANGAAPTIDYGAAGQQAQMAMGAAGQANTARGQQQDALALQRQAARGQAPSVAQLQMQQGMENAVASQQSQAASARGPAALAMAQSQAAGNIAAAQQNTAAQTAQLRAGEMAQARNEYAQGASGIRSGDVSQQGVYQQGQNIAGQQAQAQAQMQAQQNALNQQGWLQAQGLGQQGQLGSEQAGIGVMNQNLTAQVQGQQLNSENYNKAQELYQKQLEGNAERDQKTNKGLFDSAVSAIGSVAGAFLSDEREKRDISPVGDEDSDEGGASRGAGAKPTSFQRMAQQGNNMAAMYPGGPMGSMAMSDRRAKQDAYEAGAEDMQSQMRAMFGAPGPAQEKAAHDSFQWGHGAPGGDPRMSDAEAAGLARDADRMQAEQAAMYGAPSQMLDQLDPYAFKYKPGTGMDPNEQHYGVMAQDLERSPMGASLVRDTPDGKMVDTKKATMANMAAATDLHDRVKALEMSRSPLADKLANDPYAGGFAWGYGR